MLAPEAFGRSRPVLLFSAIDLFKTSLSLDHLFNKKPMAASLWFRSAEGALRTIDGYEAMHLSRKGQIRWLPKGDVVGQRRFIHTLCGMAA
jgi:hypothetical protein